MNKKLENMTKAELIKEVKRLKRLKRKIAEDIRARLEPISLANKYLDERAN